MIASIVSCDVLGLEESFHRTCFGCVFFKTCQYAIIDEKVCKNLKHYEKSCLPKAYYRTINSFKKIHI